jgi:folate-binding protein YgfZ
MTTVAGDRASEDERRAAYAALRSTVAVHVLARDVVRVAGPDATDYLQGQCSQDVAALDIGGTADALLLSPQGKVEVFLRVTRVEDGFILDTDEGFGPEIIARLLRFRLRVKVDFDPLDWVCVAVRGPGTAGALVGRPELVLPVEWPGLSGTDLLGPAPSGGLGQWVGDIVRCDESAWEAARIEAGVPVNGREVMAGSIAAELGLVDRTVSFTKGCFTGQELVARLDSRGSNVARRLGGVVVEGRWEDAPVPVGATVTTPDGDHTVGSISSVAWSPGRRATVALATLHRRVVPPQSVLVGWEDGGGSHSMVADALQLPLVV